MFVKGFGPEQAALAQSQHFDQLEALWNKRSPPRSRRLFQVTFNLILMLVKHVCHSSEQMNTLFFHYPTYKNIQFLHMLIKIENNGKLNVLPWCRPIWGNHT